MIKVPYTNIELPEVTVAHLSYYKKRCDELYKTAYITTKGIGVVPLLADIGAPIFGTEKLKCEPKYGADGTFFYITHRERGKWRSAQTGEEIYFKVTTEYSDDIHIETNSYLGMEELPKVIEEMLIECLNLVADATSKNDDKIRQLIAAGRGTVANMEFGI